MQNIFEQFNEQPLALKAAEVVTGLSLLYEASHGHKLLTNFDRLNYDASRQLILSEEAYGIAARFDLIRNNLDVVYREGIGEISFPWGGLGSSQKSEGYLGLRGKDLALYNAARGSINELSQIVASKRMENSVTDLAPFDIWFDKQYHNQFLSKGSFDILMNDRAVQNFYESRGRPLNLDTLSNDLNLKAGIAGEHSYLQQLHRRALNPIKAGITAGILTSAYQWYSSK